MQIEFQPPSEPPQLDPIDWKSVQDKISKLQAATLEQLKQNDPKLAEIQAEYEKAGGDPALLAKRVGAMEARCRGRACRATRNAATNTRPAKKSSANTTTKPKRGGS